MRVCVPRTRAREAALVHELEVLGVDDLQEAVEVLGGAREAGGGAGDRPGGG